jgi:hypothetical protein
MSNSTQIHFFERNITNEILVFCEENDFLMIEDAIPEKDVTTLVSALVNITSGWILIDL